MNILETNRTGQIARAWVVRGRMQARVVPSYLCESSNSCLG